MIYDYAVYEVYFDFLCNPLQSSLFCVFVWYDYTTNHDTAGFLWFLGFPLVYLFFGSWFILSWFSSLFLFTMLVFLFPAHLVQ